MSRHRQHESASHIPAVYDLRRLFRLRDTLDSLHPSDPPQVCLVSAAPTRPLRRVGILCGSFNPITRAHTELARQVCQGWQLDQVFFSLAKVTVDKEHVTGMSLEDRLLLLSLYAERHAKLSKMSVAVVNRGLYVEQARAFRTLLGPDTQLFFVIGMDKLLQILDPRYYQDRDTALHELFDLASLIVANRGTFAQAEFTQVINQAENQLFRSAIHFFSLQGEMKDVSATAVRDALAEGQPIDALVPEEAYQFLATTQVYRPAYLPPLSFEDKEPLDAYAIRLALMQLLYTVRSWAERKADFQRLMQLALSPSREGRSLRRMALQLAQTDRTQAEPVASVPRSETVSREDLIHYLRRYQRAAEKEQEQ